MKYDKRTSNEQPFLVELKQYIAAYFNHRLIVSISTKNYPQLELARTRKDQHIEKSDKSRRRIFSALTCNANSPPCSAATVEASASLNRSFGEARKSRVDKIPRLQLSSILRFSVYYKNGGTIRKRAYWRCKKTPLCCARAVTIGGPEDLQLVKNAASDHICVPDVDAAEALKVVSGIKRKAEAHPEVPPAQVLRTELKDIPLGNFINLIQLQSFAHYGLLNKNIGNIIRFYVP
ncbi:hypothetical protein TKK_0019308 [Trichogramma kaykai]